MTTLRRSVSGRGLRIHKSTSVDPLDDVVRQRDGLPVTTVARTLVDLAGTLTPHQLQRTTHRAEFLRLLDASRVQVLLDGSRRHGARNLRRALTTLAHADPELTRSELEERFLALVDEAGLPRPRVNTQVAGLEVDFLWPKQRLIVETDGATAHLTAAAFEEDRRRDAALQAAGFRVVRFTWRQVVHEPDHVVAVLSALL